MSLESTKQSLTQHIEDPESRVIALSGKWGTGKSHLWKEVRAASQNELVREAIYISLFGLRDMAQVKLKLLQASLPHAESESKLGRAVSGLVDKAIQHIPGISRGFAALTDIASLLAPTRLSGKLVVLDDIERKHDGLEVNEVLGFIDEYAQQHGTRFLLILNSDELDKLDKKQLWGTLREKVIDQELTLNTSAAEAFGIAIRLTPSPHAEHIRSAVEVCRLTNIRVIRRVIRTVNRILHGHQHLAPAILSRVIPSTVLLSTINYRGIEDGPTFEFVLSAGSVEFEQAKKDDESEQGKREAKWRLMLDELGIRGADRYEMLVVEYLQSGLLEVQAVANIIDSYVVDSDATNAHEASRNFFYRTIWEHTIPETQLLEDAKALIPLVHLLDPYTVTGLQYAVSELPNGAAVGDEMISQWINSFLAKGVEDVGDYDEMFNRKLHPRIRAEFDAIKSKAQTKTTVSDAVIYIAKNSGWGHRQELAMKSASTTDFEMTIRTLPVSDLRIFMRKMLELCIGVENYRSHFGAAMDNFIEACSKIRQDPHSKRLGYLIDKLFEDAKLSSRLKPSTPEGNPHNDDLPAVQ